MSLLHTMQDGKTPLMVACCNGHKALAEVLLKHGAAVDAKDKVRAPVLVQQE
jgi:ankyrin repeat protein